MRTTTLKKMNLGNSIEDMGNENYFSFGSWDLQRVYAPLGINSKKRRLLWETSLGKWELIRSGTGASGMRNNEKIIENVNMTICGCYMVTCEYKDKLCIRQSA